MAVSRCSRSLTQRTLAGDWWLAFGVELENMGRQTNIPPELHIGLCKRKALVKTHVHALGVKLQIARQKLP